MLMASTSTVSFFAIVDFLDYLQRHDFIRFQAFLPPEEADR